MMRLYSEKNKLNFKGTIIDIESIGDFCREYDDDDSRQYSALIPTLFGYITKDKLKILCAEEKTGLDELQEEVTKLVPCLQRPIYAFQSRFERGVLHHCYGVKLKIDGELNKFTREWKGNACAELDIPNYNDPFNNVGKDCIFAWIRGDYENTIKHNRSCLLKERDILLKRDYREPDKLRMR